MEFDQPASEASLDSTYTARRRDWISVVVATLSTLIYIISFSSPFWLVTENGISLGLWKLCFPTHLVPGYVPSVNNSAHNVTCGWPADDSSMAVVQGMSCLTLVTMLACCATSVPAALGLGLTVETGLAVCNRKAVRRLQDRCRGRKKPDTESDTESKSEKVPVVAKAFFTCSIIAGLAGLTGHLIFLFRNPLADYREDDVLQYDFTIAFYWGFVAVIAMLLECGLLICFWKMYAHSSCSKKQNKWCKCCAAFTCFKCIFGGGP